MTDDGARVLTALRAALDADAAVETAMRGLGYTLVDMRTDRKLPRAVTLVFRSVTDGVFFYTEKE